MDRTTLEFVHTPIQPLVVLAAVVGHLTPTAPAKTLRFAADPTMVLELTHLLNGLLSSLEIARRRDTIFFTTHRHKLRGFHLPRLSQPKISKNPKAPLRRPDVIVCCFAVIRPNHFLTFSFLLVIVAFAHVRHTQVCALPFPHTSTNQPAECFSLLLLYKFNNKF